MRGRNPLKWKWRIIELIRLKIWSMLVGNYKKICFSLWRKMEIENQKIIIRINNFNENYFKELGYIFKRNEYIEIFVNELPKGSGFKINVECNYCHKIFKKSYRRFLETKNNLCCKECKNIKMMETSI